jgi:uncharacterized membrane protein YgcG
MKASDMLRNNNGLKTTQSVLNKQQSGADAAQKASPEQMNMNTAQAMLQGKGEQLTPPKDAHEQAARMNQQTAEGMLNGSIPTDKPSVPIVKKEEQKPQPKQLSYVDIYEMLNPKETAEQKANREKKERTKARIAALGDGLRALSNIYFSTKGAKVVHNPESDMTKVVNKRKEYMDAQREKNRAAWLAGYQRALALDEEARNKNLTLAELVRYHDMQKENNKVKNDLSQQRIDINKMRITNQQEYNQARLELDRLRREDKITQQEQELYIKLLNAQANKLRASKSGGGHGGRGGRGGSSKEDWDAEYLKLNGEHPSEVAEAGETVAKAGIKPKSAAGRKQIVKIARNKIAHKGGGSSHGGGSSSTGGKKKTGVHWIK